LFFHTALLSYHIPGEADPQREAVMAEALRSREKELDRTLAGKRAQGYRIESQDDTQAVLVMRSRRRFFNLLRGHDVRYRLSFDEQGHASSRRIESVPA
jgi:hypothetical protein